MPVSVIYHRRVHKKKAVLYNGMISPLINYRIKGAIWYQGEANSGKPDLYAASLPAWVARLRQQWARDDFYFLAVMLPGYGRIGVLRTRRPQGRAVINT